MMKIENFNLKEFFPFLEVENPVLEAYLPDEVMKKRTNLKT